MTPSGDSWFALTQRLTFILRRGSTLLIIFYRMIARFNHSHTIGDVRRYIDHANPNSAAGAYVLQTTFPTKELSDEGQSLEDAGVLGSVVVQRGL